MRLIVLVGVVGVFAVAAGVACSSFESDDNNPVDAGADGDDSCVLCNDAQQAADSAPDGGITIEQMSAGGTSVCARRSNGTVVCWGRNNEGQIGQPPQGDLLCDATTEGATGCRATPMEVPGLTNVTHVSVGEKFACARLSDGVVKCWGDNALGQLGSGEATPPTRFTLAAVPNLPPALDVEAGLANACARVTGDAGIEVYCWGSNRRAVLGSAFTDTVGGATRIKGLTGAKKVSLGVQAETACVIASDDTVLCWGRNGFGSLGHLGGLDVTCSGNGEPCNPTPMAVITAGAVRDLNVGFLSVCAITTADSNVECWGFNGYGALGQNTNDSNEHPTTTVVALGGPATALAHRHHHACALVNGTVRCWGGNPYGELGNDNSSDLCNSTYVTDHPCRPTPQTTTTLGNNNVVRLVAGRSMTFARTADGKEFAWGANGDGRLGHIPGTSNDLASCNNGFTRCNPTPQPLIFP